MKIPGVRRNAAKPQAELIPTVLCDATSLRAGVVHSVAQGPKLPSGVAIDAAVQLFESRH